MDDAFETSLEVQSHQILLLDDVMTTGSTLNATQGASKKPVQEVSVYLSWAGECGIQLKMNSLMPETQKIRTTRPSKKVYRSLLRQLEFQQILSMICPIDHKVPGCLIYQQASFGIQMNF